MTEVTASLALARVADELAAHSADSFQQAPPALRGPSRHFESGKSLQRKVERQLRSVSNAGRSQGHPGVVHLVNSIGTSLSAFDQSRCEGSMWTQKYAPISAEHVLQEGQEANFLRDWLRNLKVHAVDTGSSESGGLKSIGGLGQRKTKKRKKLDDFVVSSDEEDFEQDDVSECELDWAPNPLQGPARKTVRKNISRRSLKENARFTNAVVLSGPHGCGKTATVYAIAKELDFEVFEINPGSRRSGKDIMEKVGDMTQNHLVQHKQTSADDPASIEAEKVADDEVARDIKSGQQGTMTAFFKPNATVPKTNIAATPQPHARSAPEKSSKTHVPNPKNQKQSLILLEEADILYDEDKQFWQTVVALMTQSKRPFVITCNDESLLPFQTLNLHGIFRFTRPPRDSALDLLLSIAANEGHALQRDAVGALYDSKHHDLRASITELNYWCQIGVGDSKGGFGWFYPRWPKGVDKDKHGDKIRVVSAETYQTAMGWHCRDTLLVSSAYRSVEEEILHQTWENWEVDGINPQAPVDHIAASTRHSLPSLDEKLRNLNLLDTIADTLSAADICCFGAFANNSHEMLDATQPNMPNKTRDDFICGRRLLDAPTMNQYGNVALQISTTLKAMSAKLLETECPDRRERWPLLGESALQRQIHTSFTTASLTSPTVTRYDFSEAFDAIAISDKAPPQVTSSSMDPSVFDRNMEMLVLDVAPYVRAIVASDQRLQQERLLRSTLLSERGSTSKKRMRTTRSAYSALEGGSRRSTRRDKYFSADINPYLVQRTGGVDWEVVAAEATIGEDRVGGEDDQLLATDASAQLSSDEERDMSLG